MFLLLIVLSSCSALQRQGINIASSIVAEGTYEIETDRNLELVSNALPANLKFIESLAYIHPKNENLQLALLKGYIGIAFATNETDYYEEFLAEIDNGPAFKQTVLNYSKALRYGLKYFKQNGISFQKLSKTSKSEKEFEELLDSQLDRDDRNDFEAVFYTAQALASLVNLQKGNLALVAQLPLAKSMFDWVCSADPDFHFGACKIFYASYYASRPRMLGGNPVKAKKIYYESIKKWPRNYLIRLSYLQSYVVPMIDEDEYDKHKKVFELFIRNQPLSWSPDETRESSVEKVDPTLNLYNEIAIKRYKIIKKFEKSIF